MYWQCTIGTAHVRYWVSGILKLGWRAYIPEMFDSPSLLGQP